MNTHHLINSQGIGPGYFVRILTGIALLTVTASALADDPSQARQIAFKTMLRTFEPMGVVVRGRDPYVAKQFQQQSDTLRTLARQPFTHFGSPGNDPKNRAKPNIWSQPAQFQHERDQFYNRVDALAVAARTGQLPAIRTAYSNVAQSCKHCHDAFRGPLK